MFNIINRILIFSTIVLLLSGCFGSSSVDTGLEPSEIIVIDDDYATMIRLERGEVLAVDMAHPLGKGYKISGTSFDPDMLRMERYLEYEEDGVSRARYLFTVLMNGASDIIIKMTPLQGGAEEVYRQITVSTDEPDGLF